MTRFLASVLTLAACLASSPPGRGGDSGPPGLQRERGDGWSRLDVRIPGRLVSYALPREGDGSRWLVLLVSPREYVADVEDDGHDGHGGNHGHDERDGAGNGAQLPPCPESGRVDEVPLALYVVDPSAADELRMVKRNLPHDGGSVEALDLDGDGRDELLFVRPGEVFRIVGFRGDDAEESVVARLFEDPAMEWSGLHPRTTRHPELDDHLLLTSIEPGDLRFFGPLRDHEGWGETGHLDLPIEGRVTGGAIRVGSPAPRYVGMTDDGGLILATTPEPFGKQRLRTHRIDVPPSGEPILTECWARLPGPEELLDTTYLMIAGEPLLLVTTRTAEKLSLFGEKRLRIFPLLLDRSRLGRPPLFEAESRMNLWQDGNFFHFDVSGDGIDDLVAGYWKGLVKSKVVLDVYLGEPDGGFETSVRKTAFSVKDGDEDLVQYGEDANGNGFPDLIVRTGHSLLLYPGRRSTDGKNLVATKPEELPVGDMSGSPGHVVMQFSTTGVQAWSVPSMSGHPRFADLDGDGRTEILLVQQGGETRPGVFRAIWFGRGSMNAR